MAEILIMMTGEITSLKQLLYTLHCITNSQYDKNENEEKENIKFLCPNQRGRGF